MEDKKSDKARLLKDYRMLDRMTKELLKSRNDIIRINRSVAKRVKSDLKAGIIDGLDVVLGQMDKARKELDKAKKGLKEI
ncbi:MAG: hypothetical protein KGI00_00150 [Candidatus Micrarchaeota archaeon]|nr:hypothetical protein [Candidatus Micrarchaeota archaeon]MDE1824496.1 hypothetical protein [Candidatus Micrarchaeota archaeon]MDE1849128.1 hypothetical protein [Candidatus Micrarchaeota archaeon]